MQESQPRYKQKRLSKRLCEAETWYKQGAKLSRMVLGKSVDFFDLTWDERQMVEDYDCGGSARNFGRPAQRKDGSAALPWRGSRAAMTVLNSRRRSSCLGFSLEVSYAVVLANL